MKNIIFLLCSLFSLSHAFDITEYGIHRSRILKQEEMRMFGNDLSLNCDEQIVNGILMRAKYTELDGGISEPSKFLPIQNFISSVDQIRRSPVYRIIEKMPKGSVLHVHEASMLSLEYILFNITNRPNLFVCNDNSDFKLKFFGTPDNTCNWILLQTLRKKDALIDTKIRDRLTMSETSTSDTAWRKFESIFRFIAPIITYRPVFEEWINQGLLEHYNDKVLYMEIRTSIKELYNLNGTTYTSLDTVRVYDNIITRFTTEHRDFVGAKLIYSTTRIRLTKANLQKRVQFVRKLKNEFPHLLAGFDLVGHEDVGVSLENFAEEFISLGNEDINFFFHAGETNWFGTRVDENLVDAILLNTKRIGHGLAVIKHPQLLETIRAKKIAIELSPISNQVLTFVQNIQNHPAAILFADNYPIVVSNDDPGFWEAKGVSYDFYETFVGIMSRKADLRALKKLSLNSIEYSTMDQELKNATLKIWNEQWKTFINEIQT